MSRLALVLLLLSSCAAPPKPALTADEERVLRPIPAPPPQGVQPLVDRGDDYFLAAIREKAGQPALDLYGKARASYLEAQTHYSGLVPPPLLDRVKECVNRIAALQRDAHRSK